MASKDDEVPSLSAIVRKRIFQRFGIPGLILCASVIAIVSLWIKWDEIQRVPGVSSITERLSRENIPAADPTRFSIMVADIDGDTDHAYGNLIVRLLRDFEGAQILHLNRIISVKGTKPEQQERNGHLQARDYLNKAMLRSSSGEAFFGMREKRNPICISHRRAARLTDPGNTP